MATELKIEKRKENSKPRALRREGLIPATIYGPELENAIDIQVNGKDFKKVSFKDYKHLIELKDNETLHETLIRNIQKDFVTGEILNIEFYKVKSGNKLNTKVALRFVGDSPAAKMGCDIVTQFTEMNVRCLPRDIPEDFEIDISVLKKPADMINFGDLNLGDKLELLDPSGEIIVKVVAKRGAITESAAEAQK